MGEKGIDCNGPRRDLLTTLLGKCQEMLAPTMSAFNEKDREDRDRIGDMVEADDGACGDDDEDESTSKTKLAECLQTMGCISGNENVFS